MGNSVKKQVLFFVLLCTQSLMGKTVTIFEDSLDEFIDRCAKDEEEKVEFRGYYSRFLEKQAKSRKNEKSSHLRRLRSAALKNLERHHPQWYKQVEPFVLDLSQAHADTRNVRLFLTRFALLEEYRELQLAPQEGIWHTTKSYLKSFGHKVANFKDRVLGNKEVTA